jgi:predicted ATPase/class 3 adenylate cyclase/DNA-binding CsgD family transcriptional regulator
MTVTPEANWPAGTVTFLFTDVQSSTRLWEEHPLAMGPALARHDELVAEAIGSHGGRVVKTTGDGFMAVFANPADALGAALDAQPALAAEKWGETGPLLMRIGVHTGDGEHRGGDYFGPTVNRAARVMAVAHGGQIVCTRTTADHAGPGFATKSLGQHRLRDLGAAQELFQVGEGTFPALGSVDAVPTNLPTVLTELIGRADDVERIAGLFGSERLVTLTGVGGVGKTRLALAAAAAVTASFPDGVWFVELAPTSSTDEVVRAAATAMGAPAGDRAGLATYVAERKALIVLDNCEHVLDEAAGLAGAILVAGPEPVIVATSREPLGVDGEVVRGVRSLAVPDPDGDGAADTPAVQLFVERAAAATERFALTDANTAAVTSICSQLDGIPLAIELAAARVRAMPPDEIARRLGERFRLLSAGRGAQERHRTLQAAVSWSHDLLGEDEKTVFRRLAVFPSTFDLDAAEAVGLDPEIDVIDALLRLVDQSLVEYDETTGRYRLLETLRQYGADRLADARETDLARHRHTGHYLALAEMLDATGDFPSLSTIERVSAEMDNFQAATAELATEGRWAEQLHLARHICEPILHLRALTGYRWYRDALEHESTVSDQDLIDALGELEQFRILAGVADDGWSGRSIELADQLGLPHSVYAWQSRSITVLADDPGAAVMCTQRSLEVAEQRGDQRAVVVALGQLACVRGAFGDIEESERLAAEVIRRAEELGSPIGTATAVICAAGSYLTTRFVPDFERGLEVLEASPLESANSVSSLNIWSEWLSGLAQLGLGNIAEAVHHLALAMRESEKLHSGLQKDVALGLTVALYEAGRPTIAGTFGGYADATFVAHTMRDLSFVWLTARLDAAEAALDAGQVAADRATGARLDRRSFMRLLAEAEQTSPPRTEAVEVGDEADLTNRQMEIAALVARGLTNKAIAERLDISAYTVETHVRNILERLDATSRTQIASWWLARNPR